MGNLNVCNGGSGNQLPPYNLFGRTVGSLNETLLWVTTGDNTTAVPPTGSMGYHNLATLSGRAYCRSQNSPAILGDQIRTPSAAPFAATAATRLPLPKDVVDQNRDALAW